MREIAEFELAIQGGTERIEQLGKSLSFTLAPAPSLTTPTGEQGKVEESIKEAEAVEALKNEKTEKEVRVSLS